MSSGNRLYWGTFPDAASNADALARSPDVIPMSRGEMYLAACMDILRRDHGFVAATDSGKPLDANGNWIPLFTYPCIEYISQFDLRDKRVFEWGSGASTLFWMQRAKSVVSIENNPDWFATMSQLKAANVALVMDATDNFPFCIDEYPHPFDIIVIDSYGYRYDCATEAIKKLAPGGMIILDNADWHPMSAGVLKSSGLIEIDFSGFKVTECHASTTSVFLHRDFDFPTRQPTQPSYCIGSRHTISGWDRPYAKRHQPPTKP